MNWLQVRVEIAGPEGQPKWIVEMPVRREDGVTYRNLLDKIEAKMLTAGGVERKPDDLWRWADSDL